MIIVVLKVVTRGHFLLFYTCRRCTHHNGQRRQRVTEGKLFNLDKMLIKIINDWADVCLWMRLDRGATPLSSEIMQSQWNAIIFRLRSPKLTRKVHVAFSSASFFFPSTSTDAIQRGNISPFPSAHANKALDGFLPLQRGTTLLRHIWARDVQDIRADGFPNVLATNGIASPQELHWKAPPRTKAAASTSETAGLCRSRKCEIFSSSTMIKVKSGLHSHRRWKCHLIGKGRKERRRKRSRRRVSYCVNNTCNIIFSSSFPLNKTEEVDQKGSKIRNVKSQFRTKNVLFIIIKS